jgi:osmoprotectant transport system permease protein
VLLLLACVAIAAVALPFVNVAPNRLVSGRARALAGLVVYAAAAGAALGAVARFIALAGAYRAWLTLPLRSSLLYCSGARAGGNADGQAESPLARTSPAAACGCGWRCVCWPAAMPFVV